MYQIEKTFQFDAAHRLPNHQGKCAHLHGHTWTLTIVLRAPTLHEEGPQAGMVMDYGEISRIVKPLVDSLDHQHLNDAFDNPTSEILAARIFKNLKPKFQGLLYEVRLSETPNSLCIYNEADQ